MNTLTKQRIGKQELSIFIRDLSSDINVNLRHMVEDMLKNDKAGMQVSNRSIKGKKKKPLKKKDIIIQEQNRLRLKKNIDDDLSRINFFIDNIDNKRPFDNLGKLKTDEGKCRLKYELLRLFWEDKKKYMKYIIILFYELKESDIKDDEVKGLLNKVERVLSGCDTKHYMMSQMGNLLKPLDYWNKCENHFDGWQKDVIRLIKGNQSIFVRAPTSAGKSFIAMACGIIHKKILYVCPAKPVAYQVGSHFINMGYKVHFLLDNLSQFSYSPQTNIFIGTPNEIEDNLMKIGNHFDYVVFDEVHNINKEEDGDTYENLIKLIPCNFLALSATIRNVDYIIGKFRDIKPKHKINYIEYNTRFINHQRWVWKMGQLERIHPLCVFNGIDDDSYKDNHLSFTPSDCSILWDKVEEVFEDMNDGVDVIEDCSPDEYFSEERLLTLDDCRRYELFLKKKLKDLSNKYPSEVQSIFDSFIDKPNMGDGGNNNIIGLLRETKERDMLPMIMFHTDEDQCRVLFDNIYDYLNNKELEEYPYHYDILEKKEELYQEHIKQRAIHRDNLKVTSTNPTYEINEKMKIFDKNQKSNYIKTMIEYYQSKLNDIKGDSDNDERVRNIQEHNLLNEMNSFILNPDFSYQDVFRKHSSFIFTTTENPMSGETIKGVRNEIRKSLGLKIPYENPLFQMLKRGIGIFLENMPDEYNWQLQKLLSRKEIGVVISDKTLCLGIDLPVKTTCFLGINDIKFTKDEYLQMSGRAGRRGKDSQGNIVFYGDLDYLGLMKSEQPNIEGIKRPIYNNYKSLHSGYIVNESLFKNMINPERKYIEIRNVTMNEEGRKVLWALRKYENACYFILNLFNIEKELYSIDKSSRSLLFLKKISSLICDTNYSVTEENYKLKKIVQFSMVPVFREYADVLLKVSNNIRRDKYMIIIGVSKELFSNINSMIFSRII